MFHLKNITFSKRFLLSVIAAVLLLSLPVVHLTNLYKTDLYEEEKSRIANEVREVHSVIASYHKLAEEGLVSEEIAKSLALSLIKSERYSNGHYFWVQDEFSNMIVHAINNKIGDKNMASTKDAQGYPLFDKISQLARTEGQGFVQYHAIKPGGNKPLLKVAYIQSYRPWGWIIGTGFYVDDIEAQVTSSVTRIIITIVVAVSVLIMLILCAFPTHNRENLCSQ